MLRFCNWIFSSSVILFSSVDYVFHIIIYNNTFNFHLCKPYFFIVSNASFSIFMISFSAFWCPVCVLGCAAIISWTLDASAVPILP